MKPKIIFWGSPAFALPSLESAHQLAEITAVITRPDSQQGRGLQAKSTLIKKRAQELGLKVLTPEKLDQTFIEQLRPYLPATFLIVAYGKIIPQAVLDLSQLPSLNIHPSLLPKYRGPSPIQSAILNGEIQTGVSLMQLDAQMDHGPIVKQISVAIEPTETSEQLHDKLAIISAQVLQGGLPEYLKSSIMAKAQDDSQATICKLIKKEDGLIDWNFSAEKVYNLIRAFNPWPGSYFDWNGRHLKIIEAIPATIENKRNPGEFYRQEDRLLINCSDKPLQIKRLQLEGKKEMTATEFMNGYLR